MSLRALMAKVGMGVLGAGIMGERLLRAAAGQDAVSIVGLWDPSTVVLSRLATALPALPIMSCAAEVISAADCVYVASPPATICPMPARYWLQARHFSARSHWR